MELQTKFLYRAIKLILPITLLISLFFSFNLAFAQNQSNVPAGNSSGVNIPNYDAVVGNLDNPIKAESTVELLFGLMHAFLLVIGVLALAVIIYGGFQMTVSAGNEKLVASGKRAVTWAIFGLVVAMLSYSIVSIVQNFIGVKPPG